MPEEIDFRRDLYRGTAAAHDRYRPGHPSEMLDDLVSRAGVTGHGRLMDLACGTGQIAFALQSHFAEISAVDQERDMVEMVRQKASARRLEHIHAVVSAAEDLDAPAGSFELIAIGNAFHRLRREQVAQRALGWLQPGGCLALVWTDSPWRGEDAWQRAMAATLESWTAHTASGSRVPAGWEQARARDPDRAVLERAGFELLGSTTWATHQDWTIDDLVGLVASTSFLPATVLGDQGPAFERDLRDALGHPDPAHRFRDTSEARCELARRAA